VSITDYLLGSLPGIYSFPESSGNDITVFDNNGLFFRSIRDDLMLVNSPDHFIYFAGYWTDIDLPLGDPMEATGRPPTLGEVLKLVTKPPDPSGEMTAAEVEHHAVPEVRCMLWYQKGQFDDAAVAYIIDEPASVLKLSAAQLFPNSIFGADKLSILNLASVQLVDAVGGKGILDNRTLLFGSHHQKFMVIRNSKGLVGYVGSSDFNED